MKNEKGITLATLTVYIIITVMGIAILATIMAYFSRDVKDISKNNIEVVELDKFYSYFLQDVKKTNNDISEIAANNKSITFTSGNTYSFSDKTIFFNETIKLAENIDACTFTEGTQNGKTTITTAIIINDNTYTRTFVLSNKTATIAQVDEEDYVYHTLPAEYQRVEYIESTGAQYIDTGVIGKSDIKMHTEMSFIDFPAQNSPIFGSYGNSQRCYLLSYASGGYFSATGAAGLTSTSQIALNTKYKIDVDFTTGNQKLIIDGVTAATNNNTTVLNTGKPIFLFGYNYDGGFDTRFPISMRLYSLKLYDNGNLIRDFIPCYRKSDAKPGLFDLVELKFYINAGTGDFNVAGDNIENYQRVEYIASTGTQYINTHIIGKSGIKMYTELSFTSLPTASSPIFGSYGNSQRCYLLSYSSTGCFAATAAVGLTSNIQIVKDTKYNIDVDFAIGDQKLIVDGATAATNNSSTAVNTQKPIFLFGYNWDGNFDTRYPVRIRLYRLQLYDDGSLVRDFVPCKRKTDSKPGLFDLVEGRFYINAATTGDDFDVGPNI